MQTKALAALATFITLFAEMTLAQVIIPNELVPYAQPEYCRTNVDEENIHVLFDPNEDALYENYTFREIFFGGSKNITCPSFISLRLLTPNLKDAERSVFCLSYDEEQDTLVGFAEGERDAHLICKNPSVPLCDRVNATKEEALAIVGLGAGASAGATVAASAAGVTAVTHSSGAVILTGGSGYIAGTLGGLATSALSVLTAPVTLTAAVVSVVAVGGAVYVCRPVASEVE